MGEKPFPVLRVAAASAAAVATAFLAWKQVQQPSEGDYKPFNDHGQMFCPVAGQAAQQGDAKGGDPFNAHRVEDMKTFWAQDQAGRKIATFSFDYNEKATAANKDFFKDIPPGVIADPNVRFILSGHATYDLDSKYNLPMAQHVPRGFDQENAKHLVNNFNVAQQRLDFIEGRLVAAGVPQGRIIKHNYGVRFDKAEVNLEVCVAP